MQKTKNWFSFVELIVVISIITLISVIWVSINHNYTEKSKNTRITADVKTIRNALESYRNDNKGLPDPKWNQRFFDDSANYVHYDDVNAYWVAWFVTEDTIPKKYMDTLPLDPRTSQYYAYGKTLTWVTYFEVAWVNKVNWSYVSMVTWDYSWESWPYNLIREYNWPDFVYDKSRINFPYNPDERLLKAKIWTYSWSVTVNWNPINPTWIKENFLDSWDTILVSIWWQAEIYFSDWSKSYLWDTTKASELTLANMKYKEDNNLYTKIQLALSYGSIWTKTSKLDPKSDFEIYTTDTEAAVRWTIFWVSKDSMWWITKVEVETWSVEIKKIVSDLSTPIDIIINNLIKGIELDTSEIYYGGGMVDSVTLTNWVVWVSFSSVTNMLPWDSVEPVIIETDWLTNIQPRLISTWSGYAKIGFPLSFSWTNKIVKLNPNNWINNFSWNILRLNGLTNNTQYSLKVCDQNNIRCTKELFFKVTDSVSLWDVEEIKNAWLCDDILIWWKLVCVPKDESLAASWYELVAFAPYDRPGDIDMYTRNWVLEKETKWILDSEVDNSTELQSHSILSGSFNDEYINSSYYDKDWVKGIFIGTGSNVPDFLKYDISKLWIWSSFAVEMWVRGESLKRNSWTFYLYSNNDIYFDIHIWTWWLWYLPGYKNVRKISDFSTLQNDIFYKNISTFSWSDWNLSIQWNTNINSVDWPVSTWTLKILNTFIYIWSNWSGYQWNDIIDYVKIYKK